MNYNNMVIQKKVKKGCLILIPSLCLFAVICSNTVCSTHFGECQSNYLNNSDTLRVIIKIDEQNNFFIDGEEVLPPFYNKRYNGESVLTDSSDVDLPPFVETFLNRKKALHNKYPEKALRATIKISNKASVGSFKRAKAALFQNDQLYDFEITKSSVDTPCSKQRSNECY